MNRLIKVLHTGTSGDFRRCDLPIRVALIIRPVGTGKLLENEVT